MQNQSSQPRPVILGLTGSIGAGKSTVAQWLAQQGVTVLDADQVARQLTEQPQVLQDIEQLFAGAVKQGRLDRQQLSVQVFGQPAKLAQLNALLHPQVRARMQQLTTEAANRGEQLVVQDIPLLYENRLEQQLAAVLVVDAPLEQRIARVMARSGLSREEILARNARQYPAEQKRQRADWLIINSGDVKSLNKKLSQLWPKILSQLLK